MIRKQLSTDEILASLPSDRLRCWEDYNDAILNYKNLGEHLEKEKAARADNNITYAMISLLILAFASISFGEKLQLSKQAANIIGPCFLFSFFVGTFYLTRERKSTEKEYEKTREAVILITNLLKADIRALLPSPLSDSRRVEMTDEDSMLLGLELGAIEILECENLFERVRRESDLETVLRVGEKLRDARAEFEGLWLVNEKFGHCDDITKETVFTNAKKRVALPA